MASVAAAAIDRQAAMEELRQAIADAIPGVGLPEYPTYSRDPKLLESMQLRWAAEVVGIVAREMTDSKDPDERASAEIERLGNALKEAEGEVVRLQTELDSIEFVDDTDDADTTEAETDMEREATPVEGDVVDNTAGEPSETVIDPSGDVVGDPEMPAPPDAPPATQAPASVDEAKPATPATPKKSKTA